MSEFLAHYDKDGRSQSLYDHTTGVARHAAKEGAKVDVEHMAELIAILHDAGKFSDEFQGYLIKDSTEGGKGDVNHSSAGAEILYCLFAGAGRNWEYQVLRELLSYVISAHHGVYDIVNLREEDVYRRRMEAIEEPKLQIILSRWLHELQIPKEELQKYVRQAAKEYGRVFVERFKDIKRRDEDEYLFYVGCLARLLLSIQIDADWSDTARAMDPEQSIDVPEAALAYRGAWENYEEYMDALRREAEKKSISEKAREVNHLREQIREECMGFTRHGPGIHCLSIPTGAGKTLTSLGYALKYAREQAGDAAIPEHIYYISPYISITEQNAEVIREAVGNARWVLEHHSNVSNSDEQGSDIETAWEERFICTTMVQFLQTLFSDRKKSIRRFHKLKQSVIILDEIQSLPVKTLHTFNLMLNFLAEVCHANIILCTATQPALDSEFIQRRLWYSEPRDMIADLTRKFAMFERVQIQCHRDAHQRIKKESMESLAVCIMEEFQTVHSALVILNKKQTVAEFYDRAKEAIAGVRVYYLTTNLCAQHRRDRIAEIKGKLRQGEEKILIVSTNLIEAGVDLSVECVYRSLAGIDSIAQAAGRCNRNGELSCGTVHVFELEGDEPGKHMGELLVAQDKTREIVYRHAKRQAQESILFPEWMRQYYEAFYEEMRAQMDFPLHGECQGETIFGLLSRGFSDVQAPHVMKQAFQTAGRQYEIIADAGVTVIVPYREGMDLIAELEACLEQRAGKFRTCLRRLQPYTVSVYHYKKEELLEKGVIRESGMLPEVYIAAGYQEEMGLVNMLPEAIF